MGKSAKRSGKESFLKVNPTSILNRSKDWQSFKEQLVSLNPKDKGDCFELLTERFLCLDPTYASLLKKVWPLGKLPEKVRKHLNLPLTDEGIDLVAETKEGDYWAIQCKYKTDENSSLTRKELSTFTDLAFGICNNFTFGLVCTSADRFSRKLKLHEGKIGFCSGERWRALDEDFFSRIHADIEGRAKKIEPFKPRDHQKRAIRNAVKHFVKEKASRGKLIMPCGSGKSLAAYWIAEKFGSKKILVAVPSLALIRQTLEVWTRESLAAKKNFRWICVCSDQSVGKVESDDIAILSQDLGVKISTDQEQISKWLRKRTTQTSVTFVTYQSGATLADAAKSAGWKFDLGVFDEAHKTVGGKDSLFAHLLRDENLKIDKRLFMTATERRYQGSSERIVSMDDPQLFGDTFELLSFKEAIEIKPPILSDYKVITIGITTDEIRELVKKNVMVRPNLGRWSKDMETRMLASAIALRKAMKQEPIRHAVSFHSSIARAKAFAEIQDRLSRNIPECGDLETMHISGAMPTSVRAAMLDEFVQSDRGLVTNARCLTEGIDVKQIDCVLFADPKKSAVDIVQATGRALRPFEGKRFGYVILPLLLDSQKLKQRIEQSEAYQDVLMTLRALASNDDRIIDYFRQISCGKKGRGGFEFIPPEGESVDALELFDEIQLKVWDRLANLSWRPFEEARRYVQGLRLKSSDRWRLYRQGDLDGFNRKPADIPSHPDYVYRDLGWIDMGDWLGTNFVATRKRIYREFDSARGFVRSLEISSQVNYKTWCKDGLEGLPEKPEDIPANANRTYKSDWISWPDWLGSSHVSNVEKRKRRLPFNEARKFVRKLNMKTIKEWTSYCKGELSHLPSKPLGIPSYPNESYENHEWISWTDWLGHGILPPHLINYRSHEEARSFVRALKLQREKEWAAYCKGELLDLPPKPADIPASPEYKYENKGWINFGDWLGTGSVATRERKYRNFESARKFARSLKLKGQKEWSSYCKGEISNLPTKPNDIPADPSSVYKGKGWINLGDWLGTGFVHCKDRTYRDFEDAKEFALKLGLNSQKEWDRFCHGEMKLDIDPPKDIPLAPHSFYKNKGWSSWGDFLGTGYVYKRKYKSFDEAREFARSLKIAPPRIWDQWRTYCKQGLPGRPPKPEGFSTVPHTIYIDKGWKSMKDFLGAK